MEDDKNRYNDGDKKYEDYIKKVDEKYKKMEDYITNYKEKEDQIAQKLLSIQDNKEKELLPVEEKKDDSDEEDNDKEEEKDKINELENNDDNNNNSIRRVKSHNFKSFTRTRTANYNFKELMSKNSNLLGNNINTDNVEIVYNKDEEIDIIQQFQEEQNKKLSENINSLNEDEHSENLFIRRNSSTPSLQTKDSNSNVANIKKSLTMPPLENDKEEDDTPKKTLPLNKSVLDIKEKKKNKVISFDNNNILNNHKNILSGNINDRGNGHLRMTTARK